MRNRVLAVGLCAAFASLANGQQQQALEKVYQDESHCLTSADMRGEKDNPISCFCRDAIVEARYVHFTYLLSGKDRNLYGVFLALVRNIERQCGTGRLTATGLPSVSGENQDALTVAEQEDWKWNGPEVVRTYPPDEAIKRIKPEPGASVSRWVPFTVQLVYRDAQGRVVRTENYSRRELIPDFGASSAK